MSAQNNSKKRKGWKGPNSKRRQNRPPDLRRANNLFLATGGPFIFPPTLRTRMRFCTLVAQTNAASTLTNISYNCSTPNSLNGSTSVPGFAELATPTGIYNAYRVRGVRVNMKCANLDSTTAPRVVAAFSQDVVAANAISTANQDKYAAVGNSKEILLGVSTGNSKGQMSISTNLFRMYGATVFTNNDSYSYSVQGGSAVAPTTPMFLIVMIRTNVAMTTGVQIAYEFIFDVDFYMRANLAS